MSYDEATAKQPLTGEEFDAVILSEREQRHMIGTGELKGFHIMPGSEYCELRDAYIQKIQSNEQLLDLITNAARCPFDYFTSVFYKGTYEPNLPEWYFQLCDKNRFNCKRDSETICGCWKRFTTEQEDTENENNSI